MKEITIQQISADSGISERTLKYRAKTRKLGKKRGKAWVFNAQEAMALQEHGVMGSPALRKKAKTMFAEWTEA